ERPDVAEDRSTSGVGIHRSRRIARHRDDRVGAEPDHACRPGDRGVLFSASDQGDRRGPDEPSSFDIDAMSGQNMMAGREQPDRVCRLGTSRKPHNGVSGKIQ